MKLPKGYYAVQSDFENAIKDKFTYKGITYDVEEGVDLFPTLAEADKAAADVPETVIEGLTYESFSCPVILFSTGVHNVGVYPTDRVEFKESRVLLGQGACVNPNLPAENFDAPQLNPERAAEGESIIKGGHDFGTMWIRCPDLPSLTFDGFSCRNSRIADPRRQLNQDAELIFKNIIHISPCGFALYWSVSPGADCQFKKNITLQNIRIKDFNDWDYGGTAVSLNANKVILDGICCDNTDQLFGFSDIPLSWTLAAKNSELSEYIVTNSYFRGIKGEHGVSFIGKNRDGHKVSVLVNNCTFVDACRVGESPLQAYDIDLFKVTNCKFRETRENKVPAISVSGEKKNITVEGAVCEGFTAEWAELKIVPPTIHSEIANKPKSWTTDTEDPHVIIGTEEADFSALDAVYEGRKVYYGDQHVHTASGGRSDGKVPMKDWPAKMDALKLDFAIIVDHHQMRGYFLPEWDEERFVMGTEPGTMIKGLDTAYWACMHYNMLFPHKYGLAMVLANFPEFKFEGDELTGSFGYPNFTKERFMELVKYVQSIGGIFVHPHPKALMASNNPLDFYFGEHMFLEVMTGSYTTHATYRSYDLWVDLLKLGKHVFASGGSDSHTEPTNVAVSTMYSKEKSGRAFFDVMHSADYAVGAVGMQMCIDGVPMGSELEWREGMKLTLRVGDFFEPAFRDGDAYELRIITDKGLAYSSIYDGKTSQEISLEVQKRAFYRAEIFDLSGNYRIAVGNPIWLDKEPQEEKTED